MTSEQALTYRDNAIAQSKVAGMTYREMAKKFDVSPARICQVLKKSELKDLIDTGTNQIISMIPLASDIQYKTMITTDEQGNPTALAQKASELVLKTGGIVPSNVQNQTVNTVYNIQNNVTLNPGVAKALSGLSMQDDPDVIDAETV